MRCVYNMTVFPMPNSGKQLVQWTDGDLLLHNKKGPARLQYRTHGFTQNPEGLFLSDVSFAEHGYLHRANDLPATVSFRPGKAPRLNNVVYYSKGLLTRQYGRPTSIEFGPHNRIDILGFMCDVTTEHTTVDRYDEFLWPDSLSECQNWSGRAAEAIRVSTTLDVFILRTEGEVDGYLSEATAEALAHFEVSHLWDGCEPHV